MKLKRQFVFLLTLFLIFCPIWAGNPQKAIADFLSVNDVPANSVAVKIVDLSNGSTVASHNENLPLVPASIMKSVTTAALLESVGPFWKYHTRVYIDGPIEFGYLRGNVVVEGACDPTLNSDKEPYSENILNEIIDALKFQKITQIEGSIIIDEDNFSGTSRPASWAKEDWGKYYGCGSHALNYSDNSKGDNAVNNPSSLFVSHLKSQLAKEGIKLEEKYVTPRKRVQIHDHVSASMDEIMRSCMMRSDNMFAESMLRTYGKMEGTDGSTDQSAQKELTLWKKKKLPLEGVVILDGSGLSRSNRVTANFMSALLQNMSSNPTYASFFPLAGQEGTMKKFLAGTPLDSYIAMKTGSMRGIQCYAGYKLDEDYNPTHVVVIIMNELPANRDNAKKAAERMLLSIFE